MYKPSFHRNRGTETPEVGDVEIFVPSKVVEILPSEKISTGKYVKYFAYHKTSKTVLEVNYKTYNDLKNKVRTYDFRVYNIGKLNWDSTSPTLNEQLGKYVVEGSNTRNLKAVEILEEQLPGVKDYLVVKGELFI